MAVWHDRSNSVACSASQTYTHTVFFSHTSWRSCTGSSTTCKRTVPPPPLSTANMSGSPGINLSCCLRMLKKSVLHEQQGGQSSFCCAATAAFAFSNLYCRHALHAKKNANFLKVKVRLFSANSSHFSAKLVLLSQKRRKRRKCARWLHLVKPKNCANAQKCKN